MPWVSKLKKSCLSIQVNTSKQTYSKIKKSSQIYGTANTSLIES